MNYLSHLVLFSLWAASLAHYGDNSWSGEDLARVATYANLNKTPTSADVAWLRPKTSLLPGDFEVWITEDNIHTYLPEVKPEKMRLLTAEEQTVFDKIVSGRFNDDDFQLIFPARCKMDLAIRRARASTVYKLCHTSTKIEIWRHWLPRLLNLDYITVCNSLIFEYVHGDFLQLYDSVGALTSLDNYQKATKTISDYLKKHPCDMSLRLKYCETGGVSGYRNPGFDKTYDFVAESRKLAEAGEEHGLKGTDWLATFAEATAKVHGDSTVPLVKYLTLRDFIASDLATTGGASTFGKVEWEFEGEKGKFKARKNFLLDICTPEYLAEETMAHLGQQVNKSFIKAELGKMRIAVTGDLWSYFSQAWLNYLCGGVYLQWPGNTLDEDIAIQTRRMVEMLDLLELYWSLPFDYAGFDHQPSTEEEKIQMRSYLERGARNVPPAEAALWKQVLDMTIDSFSNALMYIKEPTPFSKKGYTIVKITGGVQSGIRLTSISGNMWNQTMTLVAKELCWSVGLEDMLNSWLRGDDSAIFGKTYWACLLMRLAYAGINAVGNDSKYGILYRNSEFLRIWYGEGRCWGYPNRALPGIMQRKPWGNEPWDAEGVIRAQVECINTVSRRLNRDLSHMTRVVCRDWADHRGENIEWLSLPLNYGGLGVVEWRGKYPRQKWPVPAHPKIKFTNVQADSWRRYGVDLQEWQPTQEELKTLQYDHMLAKTATDDVKGLTAIYREEYKRALLELPPEERWAETDFKPFPTKELSSVALVLRSVDNLDNFTLLIRTRDTSFGIAKKIEFWWGNVKEMATVRKEIDLMAELQAFAPTIFFELKALERTGLHRSNALDFLFGKITGIVIGTLHPLMASAVQSALSIAFREWTNAGNKWNRTVWAWFTSVVASWYARELASSTFATKVFGW